MPEPIRVLHFADTHIGMENYGKTGVSGLNSRVEDFVHRMDEMIEFARKGDVDLVIFAGDAFKTRSPNPTFQTQFALRILDLAALAPVVMLLGNHDASLTDARSSSIEIYDVLAVPNVWVAESYDLRIIETKRGEVVVATAPYPTSSRLLRDEKKSGISIAEIDAEMQDKLTEVLDELAAEADQHDLPRLLTGHFTVSGAVVGSERAIMLGRDVAIGLGAIADPRWDYVAMGHIHKHQNLTRDRDDAPPVVYSGSLERIDFGEEADPKGFCWVELERDSARWEFIPLQARPFVTLRADLTESHSPTEEVVDLISKHHLEGAVVRLMLDMTADVEAVFNDSAVHAQLRQLGASYVAGVNKLVENPARVRLGDNPEELTDTELLERYLMIQQYPEARRAELLTAAADIFDTLKE